MAYAQGFANSATDLVTALLTTCAANGWSLTGDVLTKGPTHVRVAIAGSAPQHVKLEMGSTSSFASPGYHGVGQFPYIHLNNAFPVHYRIFVISDGAGGETVMMHVLEQNAVDYKHLSFGCLQNKVGSWTDGSWISATYGSSVEAASNAYTMLQTGPGVEIDNASGGAYNDQYAGFYHNPIPFGMQNGYPNFGNDFINPQTWLRAVGVDGGPMLTNISVSVGNTNAIDCLRFAKLALARGKNTWNGEACLVPIHVYQHRASSTYSRLGTVAGLRLVRMDNFENGDIITLGQDRWMLLPVFRRNQADPLGQKPFFTLDNGHTGTIGFAIAYDGA